MASNVVPQGANHAPALHTLVRKRAELAGELNREQLRLRELRDAIAHVDAVLLLLNPDVRIENIRPTRAPVRNAAAYGQITGAIIDCLREAEFPLTSTELTQAVIQARDLDEHDRELELLMAKRVRACLRYHRAAGRVRTVTLTRPPQGWVLVGGRAERLLTPPSNDQELGSVSV